MEPVITLPLSALRSLVFGEFGDKTLSGLCKPISPLLSDTPPKVTHYELGELIASVDPDELYIHVELIPTPRQAELWLAHEWRDSIARRERFRAYQKAHRDELVEKKETSDEIADDIALALPEHIAKAIAARITENWKKHDLTALMKELKMTEEIIKKYTK